MPNRLPGNATSAPVPPPDEDKKTKGKSNSKSKKLRTWWQDILRRHGRYPSTCVFLCLPSDKEVIRYLKDFGTELNQISSDNCLVLGLSDTQFHRFNSDEEIHWKIAIEEQVRKGYSIRIAELFQIGVDEFPSIVVFTDIRADEYVLINLKNLSAEEIASKMRSIFAVIAKAVLKKENPLSSLCQYRRNETMRFAGKMIVSEVRRITDLSIQTAIETSVKISTGHS